MTLVGVAATGVAYGQRQPAGIWITLGYFTAMEALQLAGYAVLDQCGTPANRAVTLASVLHIALQPFLINAFAMALVPGGIPPRLRASVFGFCGLSAAVMLAQLAPVAAWGTCVPGTPLCGPEVCTVSGNWHIGWSIPYNGLLVPFEQMLGMSSGFPTYMAAAFLVPLLYGAWRFVVVTGLAGPVLAWTLTSDALEMPAVWCLFSIVILLIALSPWSRSRVQPRGGGWWAAVPR